MKRRMSTKSIVLDTSVPIHALTIPYRRLLDVTMLGRIDICTVCLILRGHSR